MFSKISLIVASGAAMVLPPLDALAEPAPPSPWNGPGPWFMGGDGFGWPLWWFCPLMMLVMMLMCAIMCFGRHVRGGGPHH